PLAPRTGNVSSVTHQSAGSDEVTLRICCGDRMARRQCGKLDTPISKERVGDDEEGVHPLTHKDSECCIDVTNGAGVKDMDLEPETTGIAGCCARAASGHAAATPPSATSNFRRPMVTVIRPSRARCVKERDHATMVQSSAFKGRHPARHLEFAHNRRVARPACP